MSLPAARACIDSSSIARAQLEPPSKPSTTLPLTTKHTPDRKVNFGPPHSQQHEFPFDAGVLPSESASKKADLRSEFAPLDSGLDTDFALHLSLSDTSPTHTSSDSQNQSAASQYNSPTTGTPLSTRAPPGLRDSPTTASHTPDRRTALGHAASTPVSPPPAASPPLRRATEARGPYSLAGVPVQEMHIPEERLPDELIVYDCMVDDPIRYVRIDPASTAPDHPSGPELARDPDAPPKPPAHLYIAGENRIGGGALSNVFRAPLALPSSTEGSAETVRVVAKAPTAACGAHAQLAHEARAYGAFPARLMERHTVLLGADRAPVALVEAEPRSEMVWEEQVPFVPPAMARAIRRASDAAQERAALAQRRPSESQEKGARGFKRILSGLRRASQSSGGSSSRGSRAKRDFELGLRAAEAMLPEGHSAHTFHAVVPKFFGYYLPLTADGGLWHEAHGECGADGACEVRWPSPILLVEDCGAPVQTCLPELTLEQRKECFALYKYLHDAGFAQLSPHADDVLVQPGPLSAPPAERSLAVPSFRLVDFGRGRGRGLSGEGAPAAFEEYFSALCDVDFEHAWETLGFEDGDDE